MHNPIDNKCVKKKSWPLILQTVFQINECDICQLMNCKSTCKINCTSSMLANLIPSFLLLIIIKLEVNFVKMFFSFPTINPNLGILTN